MTTTGATGTITHVVSIAGEEAFTTQLPAGVDPDVYDQIVQNMDEHVRQEVSGGEAGAIDSLRLAVVLGDVTGKSWKQLAQDPAYADPIAHVYAKYNKVKTAYSNHRTAIRESEAKLRSALNGLPVKIDEAVKQWKLDPDREKSDGAKRKVVGEKKVEFTANETVDETPLTADDETPDADMGTGSLVGMMSACEARLKKVARDDVTSDADFLNKLRSLGRAVDDAKAFAINVHRLSN